MRHCHHQQAEHKEIFSAPSCSSSTGEEQRDINDTVARTAQPDQHQRSVEEPEATSLLLHQAPCLQPPTARNICCTFCRSQRQILEESWVFTTWCKWEFSFSWFVNTAATHKPIFFTRRWSLTLPCPTNIYNLFGTWCFKNKNSFVIMVLLCI